MADYKVTDTELTSIANAIRTKGSISNQLVFPTGFVSAIQAIPTGGGGSTNILSGLSFPTASQGNNGDIYLQLETSEFEANSAYIATSQGELLGTDANGTKYYKTNNGKAMVATWRYYNSFNRIELFVVAKSAEAAQFTNNDIATEVLINGSTWYICGGNPNNSSSMNSAFPYIGSGHNATTQDRTVIANTIASFANMQEGNLQLITSAHCKVNGVWQDLIGTNIDDVTTS